jgi:hypothetical protein
MGFSFIQAAKGFPCAIGKYKREYWPPPTCRGTLANDAHALFIELDIFHIGLHSGRAEQHCRPLINGNYYLLQSVVLNRARDASFRTARPWELLNGNARARWLTDKGTSHRPC